VQGAATGATRHTRRLESFAPRAEGWRMRLAYLVAVWCHVLAAIV
jgi:hypothetical protein